jgi:gamma-tubulin complex component 3
LPIVSQLYSYVNYCGADKLLAKVLDETSKPLFSIIKNWLLYGDLQDPYKEFFVDINDKVPDDEIWSNRYILVIPNVPNFFNKNVTRKIFEIGKCVNFIRKYCNEPTYSLLKLKIKLTMEIEKESLVRKSDNESRMIIDEEAYTQKSIKNEIELAGQKIYGNYRKCLELIMSLDSEEKMNMAILPYLNSEIDLLHYEINKDLIAILYKSFKFKTHLQSINRYFLLGQGDMMQYLMDLLFPELGKSAIHIFKHNLLSILETAIRASNAQYHDQECLKRLNIKLMDPSAGDTGWDIFILEYNIDIPLNVVFTKPLLKDYQKLFFFFWKLKRLEYSQDHQMWRNFMTYSHDLGSRFEHLRPYIHRSMMFNQQIIHFVTTIHSYITLEVLETHYKRIVEKLDSIDSLDDLIAVHKKFINDVIEQSLLNLENKAIYTKIQQILDIIINFKHSIVSMGTLTHIGLFDK